ncbi:MAG TPA: GNAT family N-acetyltransferase, partial [Clostridiales bacterium]|nr:GNAT family N-acetyltransferase [Clostridiales bacterium]
RKILYVDDLCVEEQSRGRGLGRALLEEVKKHALSIGAQSVELNVWNFNQSAVSFYEHLGFSVQKSILELPLNPAL